MYVAGPGTVKLVWLLRGKLPWVPEAFHARFPISVKSARFFSARVFGLRPAADETKLPDAREKKPLVSTVEENWPPL